jgi:DNA repair exonuclease SbcCD ATPase subunit
MHKLHLDQIKEHLKLIEEALQKQPDRDDAENGSSDVLFKLEEIHDNVREIHDDVREIQGELAEVKSQIDSIESADWP